MGRDAMLAFVGALFVAAGAATGTYAVAGVGGVAVAVGLGAVLYRRSRG